MFFSVQFKQFENVNHNSPIIKHNNEILMWIIYLGGTLKTQSTLVTIVYTFSYVCIEILSPISKFWLKNKE